jgi:phycobilisome core-membrane linker protein
MSVHANSGSPVVYPQRYHTLPTAILCQVEQQDRWLKSSEANVLTNFFQSGAKRLEIAATLTQQANAIVSAAADRIFYGGSPMLYLEPPANRENLPGYNVFPRRTSPQRSKDVLKLQTPDFGNPFRRISELLKTQLSEDRDPLPDGFRTINITRYGPVRMKRSMRDLSWFLRYVTYAIAAGDSSILTVNVRGLRGVIPEDVTEATVVSMREMRWRSVQYYKNDPEAIEIIKEPFDAMIAAYLAEKPPICLRQGVSNDHQGLQLPESYALAATQTKFVMKPQLAETEKQAVIQAAYRQVFERNVTHEYGIALTDLESRFRSGEFSTKEFIRHLGKSRLYRDLFYEPYTISRVIELAVRHFLGRGLSSMEEFQRYFDVISEGGLSALVNTLVDSQEYSDYFGEETVPYLRSLGHEAQECRNWGAQVNLFKPSAVVHKVPQFVTLFGEYQKPLPNQHCYGVGNDPLEIQFGAIFPEKDRNAEEEQPALFDRDSRRILISCEPSNGNSVGHLTEWGKVPGSLEHRVFRFTPLIHANGNNGNNGTVKQGASLDLRRHSPEAVIRAAYRQVFGRDLFANQQMTSAEVKLKSGEITMREFIRRVAKSPVFRDLYWDRLYVTKAIEYIHRRLLGRPTRDRHEMGQYYDIAARQGFYALVDAIIDSPEYSEAFGEDTVPHERYITPQGFSMRAPMYATQNSKGNPIQGERVYQGNWVHAALKRVNADNDRIHAAFQRGQGKPIVPQLEQPIDVQQLAHTVAENELDSGSESKETESSSVQAEATVL